MEAGGIERIIRRPLPQPYSLQFSRYFSITNSEKDPGTIGGLRRGFDALESGRGPNVAAAT